MRSLWALEIHLCCSCTFRFVELLERVHHYGSVSRLIGLDQSKTKREEKGQKKNIFVLPLYTILIVVYLVRCTRPSCQAYAVKRDCDDTYPTQWDVRFLVVMSYLCCL